MNDKCICETTNTNSYDASFTSRQLADFVKGRKTKHECNFVWLCTMNTTAEFHCCICNKRKYVTIKEELCLR